MSNVISISTPLSNKVIESLTVGDIVQLSGTVYTGRDAAHKRICEYLKAGKNLPINLKGQVIYYAGPCPPKPGEPIGSVGPTTASRMDSYSPILIAYGLVAMIGKGMRSEAVVSSIKENKGVYFAAIGGVAALMGKCVISSEVVAFEDLGPEAIRKLEIINLPVIVAVDAHGRDLYKR